ncbi:MAG: 2-succinyl-6-hydroxy-2,4-cyclohexadiene-1-carboxylate synthase [Stenomitos frigidus ULC029]
MGYQFHYTLHGHRDLPVVLFLHGFMGSSVDFDTVMTCLANQFCCLAVDLPGHGNTIVEGEEMLYMMPQTAHAIVTLLEQLHIPHCSLVGYSMGGRLALYLALHFPQRFQKVVLESASPGLRTEAERSARLEHDRALADQIEAAFPSFLSYWYSQPLFHALRHHPIFVQVQERRSRNHPAALARALRCLSTGLQPSLWERLPHHTQPLLLLVGADDRKFCTINQAMANCCPTAQLKIIPACGHVLHLEQPDIFTQVVQTFLR